MLKTLINYLIATVLVVCVWINVYSYYNYRMEVQDPLIKQISSSIEVELPDYYTYSVDDAYLTSYINKTWLFALDTNVTIDWLYHKEWLPLAFNYCSLLKKDAFVVDNDFDNDNIPNNKDFFPYDYSNWDYSIRKSSSLDFDSDWIVNLRDSDADWNWVEDIFQWICMDRISNDEALKKIYTKKADDIFLTHASDITPLISFQINDFIETYKIENPFPNPDNFDTFIQWVYGKLLYSDSAVIQIWDKNLIIEKKELLENIHNDDDLDFYD